MPVKLTPKQARRMGVEAPERCQERRQGKKQGREPRSSLRLSYSAACADRWSFIVSPLGVMAWRRAGGIIQQTARYPQGDGERIDQEYRAVLDAIERGEYTEGGDL